MQVAHRKRYYNNDDGKLKLKLLCYHYAVSVSTSYVFGLEDLREKNLTDRYKCYPICTDCMVDGKDVVKHGKQEKMQARKEKEDRTVKVKTVKEKSKRRAEEQEQYNLWCAISSTAGLLMSYKLGTHWNAVITRSDFKSEAIFGFLSQNYTGQST